MPPVNGLRPLTVGRAGGPGGEEPLKPGLRDRLGDQFTHLGAERVPRTDHELQRVADVTEPAQRLRRMPHLHRGRERTQRHAQRVVAHHHLSTHTVSRGNRPIHRRGRRQERAMLHPFDLTSTTPSFDRRGREQMP